MDQNALDKLTRPFPREAVKSRQGGGGRSFDYIPTHTVIHRLNDATGNNWSFEIVNLEWRKVIDGSGDRAREVDLVICYGALEIPGHGKRMGIGVQKVTDGGGEDLIKGAASDALKKAGTLFGIALELYGSDTESGEIAAPRSPQSSPRAQNASQDARPHEPAQSGSPGEIANPATKPQIGKIFAEVRRLGWDEDHARAEMMNLTGREHTKDLNIAQASTFIEYLTQQQPAQPALVP